MNLHVLRRQTLDSSLHWLIHQAVQQSGLSSRLTGDLEKSDVVEEQEEQENRDGAPLLQLSAQVRTLRSRNTYVTLNDLVGDQQMRR